MNKSISKTFKRIVSVAIIIVVFIGCYIFFNQTSSIASVNLESINDKSIVVLRPDQGYFNFTLILDHLMST